MWWRAAAVAAILFAAVRAEAGEGALADLLIEAETLGRPIPAVSAVAPGLDIETAYRVQDIYVKRRLAHDRVAGFKAAFTSEAIQKRFGLAGPLSGVLFASGSNHRSPVIDAAAFRRLAIETEVAFIVGARIDRPVADVAALRHKIRAVAPAIELPELGYAYREALLAADIIAANVSAAGFIVGMGREDEFFDLGAVSVMLYHDGAPVNEGRGADAMGDPWSAALWLVNKTVAQGWRIEPGHVLLTGALGKLVPAQPGRYRADFGALGAIEFTVE